MVPAPPIDPSELKGKYVFLDNDFLGSIFLDPELLEGSLTTLGGVFLFIDGFTRIEFLRDVWLPELRDKKEEFLSSDLFSSPTEHQQLFVQTRENALELSRIYAHQNSKSGKKVGGYSTIDLLLAGTLMFYRNSVLITGNKKDFPSCVFDTLGVMNFEQGDGSMRAISLVAFSGDKFASCKTEYAKVRKGK